MKSCRTTDEFLLRRLSNVLLRIGIESRGLCFQETSGTFVVDKNGGTQERGGHHGCLFAETTVPRKSGPRCRKALAQMSKTGSSQLLVFDGDRLVECSCSRIC